MSNQNGLQETAIDPELLANLRSQSPLFSDEITLEKIQQQFSNAPPAVSNDDTSVVKKDLLCSTADGHKVAIRVYRPSTYNKQILPLLFWIHGGGFILGNIQTEDYRCSQLAARAKCRVVSLDYRLAPQHPFPAAFNDCYDIFHQLVGQQVNGVSINPQQVAIGGASAGACLAAGLVQRITDEKRYTLRAQILMIPVTDDRPGRPSNEPVTDPRVWNTSISKRCWQAYLGAFKNHPPTYAVPARRSDLTGLPATFISVEQFDPLHDEGVEYARRLMAAGVSTELHHYPKTYHGSIAAVPKAAVSRRHLADVVLMIKKTFHGDESPND